MEINSLRYYHFTYVHHKWKSYMYGSWDMERDRQNLFSFWTIFCPFTLLPPPTTPDSPKYEKIKKMKKLPGDMRHHHFTQVYQKSWSYAILFLRYGTWHMYFFFILGYFLPFYSPSSQKKLDNEHVRLDAKWH